jgi:hypothetical protein
MEKEHSVVSPEHQTRVEQIEHDSSPVSICHGLTDFTPCSNESMI